MPSEIALRESSVTLELHNNCLTGPTPSERTVMPNLTHTLLQKVVRNHSSGIEAASSRGQQLTLGGL